MRPASAENLIVVQRYATVKVRGGRRPSSGQSPESRMLRERKGQAGPRDEGPSKEIVFYSRRGSGELDLVGHLRVSLERR